MPRRYRLAPDGEMRRTWGGKLPEEFTQRDTLAFMAETDLQLQGTVAAALGGILLNAERKNIHVSVDCPSDIVLAHDRKWTSEALFNILDNAVKYTPADGDIQVSVQS